MAPVVALRSSSSGYWISNESSFCSTSSHPRLPPCASRTYCHISPAGLSDASTVFLYKETNSPISSNHISLSTALATVPQSLGLPQSRACLPINSAAVCRELSFCSERYSATSASFLLRVSSSEGTNISIICLASEDTSRISCPADSILFFSCLRAIDSGSSGG